MEEKVYCSHCGAELSGKDEVYIDSNDCIYCSLNCLLCKLRVGNNCEGVKGRQYGKSGVED